MPGEEAWPTQPFPIKPPALVRQTLTEADLTDISPAARAYALAEFQKYRAGSMYTPPTLQGTLTQPGHLGGSEWHGGAFDPLLNVLYVNVNDAPTINRLRPIAWSRTAPRYTIENYIVFTDQDGVPAIRPPWGTLNAIDLVKGEILWKVPLGEYPQLVAKGIRNTGSMNYGGVVATAGGVIFVAATADEKFRAFESHSGRLLWEHQLPAGGYATPSVYTIGGRQYVVIAAGGGGKNATKSGDSVIAFALPAVDEPETPRSAAARGGRLDQPVRRLDPERLGASERRTHLHRRRRGHRRTDSRVERQHEFLPLFAAGIRRLRARARDDGRSGDEPGDPDPEQGEARRDRERLRELGRTRERTSGRGAAILQGPADDRLALRRSARHRWLSSQQTIDAGHRHFVDDGWNAVRIVAKGPRIQTWVNGQPVEDLVNEAVYKTHPSGFIGLQIHGINERDLALPINAGSGVTVSEPLVNRWRNIRVRPLPR